MAGYRPANRGNRSANRTGATVSRMLRAAGHNVISPDRRHVNQCMTVRAVGDHVSVLIDYGYFEKNARVAADIEATISTWPQTSDIESRKPEGDTCVYLTFTYTPKSQLTTKKEETMTEQQTATTPEVVSMITGDTTTSTVYADIAGAPETTASYSSKVFVPDAVSATYRYTPEGPTWKWTCSNIRLSGYRVLKPGPNGEQRLGKDSATATWYGENSKSLPDWVTALVRKLRPAGDVTIND